MYRPTMSRTFSISSGSVDSLNVSLRCGCRPNARQIRWTVVRPRPLAFAMSRTAPVRGAARRLFQRADDDALDRSSVIARGAPGRGSSYNPSSRSRTKRLAPLADRRLRHAQPLRHDLVIVPLGARQNDPRAPREMRRRARAMGQRVKSHAFVVRQNQRYLWASQSHARLLVSEYDWVAPLVSHSSRTGH